MDIADLAELPDLVDALQLLSPELQIPPVGAVLDELFPVDNGVAYPVESMLPASMQVHLHFLENARGQLHLGCLDNLLFLDDALLRLPLGVPGGQFGRGLGVVILGLEYLQTLLVEPGDPVGKLLCPRLLY